MVGWCWCREFRLTEQIASPSQDRSSADTLTVPLLTYILFTDPFRGTTITVSNAAPHRFDVALLPAASEPLSGVTVVVVDVLRATTTIVSALSNGAEKVLPQPSIEAARSAHESIGAGSVMGGERQGKIVDGFHHGNSPLEYTAEAITGKSLILATTNGTVAMEACRSADRVLIGAMVNVDAVAEVVFDMPRVCVMCSGTDRIITSEDVCFAGLLLERVLEKRAAKEISAPFLTDAANIALDHWQTVDRAAADGKPLVESFKTARGGINLVRIGHEADVEFASRIDSFDTVPELDLQKWEIV